MKPHLVNKTRGISWGSLLLPLLLALIFLAFTFSYFPFREKLQFDTDEGLNLMRSMLVAQGYPLYGEVSSDQPPLFTHLLALLLRIVGFEVNPARFLVLLFSTLLVWAGTQFLQLTAGKLAAIIFLPLTIMVPQYLVLSVSVMIGIPSIALAVTSMLFLAVWHRRKGNLWLFLSGFALALSVLIKLFTGFVAPIFFAGIVISEYLARKEDGFSWSVLGPAWIWSLCFAAMTILLGSLLIGPQNLWLIIFPSLTASSQAVFQSESFSMNAHLQAAVPLLVLGFLGAAVSVYRRKWLALYPLAWAVLAYSLFSFYSPVFYHHALLITVPFAMLGAVAVADGLNTLFLVRKPADVFRFQAVSGILALAGFLWLSTSTVPVLDRELMNAPRLSDFTLRATAGKLRVIRTMEEHVAQTHWILTDMPMYAFRVQRPVPPNLATFSQKRLSTGSLTENDILAAMHEYRPEQVLMARFEIPALEAYLQENYTLVLSVEFFRLFLRNDLAQGMQ